MRRGSLGCTQADELLPPSAVGPQRESLHDEPVDRFEHQDFGENELSLCGGLKLRGRFVPQAKQLVSPDGVLVTFDPLEDVLLVVLLVGIGRTAAAVHLPNFGSAQHGSTCTVTWSSWRLSRSR